MNRLSFLLAIALMLAFSACAKKNISTDSVPSGIEAVIPPNPDGSPILVSGKTKASALREICQDYDSWSTASISGKITSLNLFVTPSLKIFMRRQSELLISVRVPLKGEVARLEADRDSLIAINRLNKTYVAESLSNVAELLNLTITDIQDLFLGRLFLAGRGTLTEKDSKAVDVYSEKGEWLVVPLNASADPLVNYGFKADSHGRMTLLMLSSFFDDATVSIDREWKKKNSIMTIGFERKGKTFSLGLELDSPKWNDKGFSPVGRPAGYNHVSIRQFLKLK